MLLVDYNPSPSSSLSSTQPRGSPAPPIQASDSGACLAIAPVARQTDNYWSCRSQEAKRKSDKTRSGSSHWLIRNLDSARLRSVACLENRRMSLLAAHRCRRCPQTTATTTTTWIDLLALAGSYRSMVRLVAMRCDRSTESVRGSRCDAMRAIVPIDRVESVARLITPPVQFIMSMGMLSGRVVGCCVLLHNKLIECVMWLRLLWDCEAAQEMLFLHCANGIAIRCRMGIRAHTAKSC